MSARPQSVQEKLNKGFSPYQIYLENKSNLHALYGSAYQGGLIAHLDTNTGKGLIIQKELAFCAIRTSYSFYWGNNGEPETRQSGRTYAFYGQHYLDSINIPYSKFLSYIDQISWSPQNQNNTNVGGTQSAFGTGKSNTRKIVSTFGYGNYAAQWCDTLVANGYNDWFLPSRDELAAAANNVCLVNSGWGIWNAYRLWSSTQKSNTKAYYFDLYINWNSYKHKTSNCGVLPARYFESVQLLTTLGTVIRTARVIGKIVDAKGYQVKEKGICWSVNSIPTIQDSSFIAQNPGDTFSLSLSGLPPQTTYYARTFFKNEFGDVFYGNIVSFALLTKPTIATISNQTTTVGGVVTITGAGFNPRVLGNSILFSNGSTVMATAVLGTTSLSFIVPSNASSGKISVFNSADTSAASSQSINIITTPSLSTLFPTNTGVGRTITITGANFSKVASQNTVLFTGGTTATPISASESVLKVIIPPGVQSGPVIISIDGVNSNSSNQSLSILTGMNITLSYIGTDDILHGVAYGNNTFAAISATNNYFRYEYTNGGQWTNESKPNSSLGAYSITFGSVLSKFLICAYDDTKKIPVFLSSKNGSNWTSYEIAKEFSKTALNFVTSIGNNYIAVGQDLYPQPPENKRFGFFLESSDGKNWNGRILKCRPCFSFCSGGAYYVAVGRYRGAPSLDAPSGIDEGAIEVGDTAKMSGSREVWTSNAKKRYMYSVCYSSPLQTFVAVGDSGTIVTCDTLPSTDISWKEQVSPVKKRLNSVCWSNASQLFIAVGHDGVVLTSPDGKTWTLQQTGTTQNLFDVTAGDNTTIAVGTNGTIVEINNYPE